MKERVNGWTIEGDRLTATIKDIIISVHMETLAQNEASMEHLDGLIKDGTVAGRMLENSNIPDEPGMMLTVRMTEKGKTVLAVRMGPDGGFPKGTTLEEVARFTRPEPLGKKALETMRETLRDQPGGE